MSSCFFSSREKMRISPMSVSRKCFRTVWPKEPVPPVIINVALLNNDTFIPSIKSVLFYDNLDLLFVLTANRSKRSLKIKKLTAIDVTKQVRLTWIAKISQDAQLVCSNLNRKKQ